MNLRTTDHGLMKRIENHVGKGKSDLDTIRRLVDDYEELQEALDSAYEKLHTLQGRLCGDMDIYHRLKIRSDRLHRRVQRQEGHVIKMEIQRRCSSISRDLKEKYSAQESEVEREKIRNRILARTQKQQAMLLLRENYPLAAQYLANNMNSVEIDS